MHLVRKEITNEDQNGTSTLRPVSHWIANKTSSKNWSHNGQEQVVIVNKVAPNKYGEPKSYKIMPSRGGSGMHLTITNSSNLFNSQGKS